MEAKEQPRPQLYLFSDCALLAFCNSCVIFSMFSSFSRKAKRSLLLFVLAFYFIPTPREKDDGFFLFSSLEALPPKREEVQTPQRQGQGEATQPGNKALESIGQSWLTEIKSNKKEKEPAKAPSTPQEQNVKEGGEESPKKEPELSRPAKTEDREVQKEGPTFSSLVFRFFLFACFLGLILYFALRFFRFRRQPFFRRGDELVQVIVSLPLVQGKFLQIIDVAGQLLVLGVSDAGVQLLTSINEGISADRIRLWQSRQGSEEHPKNLLDQLTGIIKGTDMKFWNTKTKQSFSSVLNQMSGKKEATKEEESSEKTAELKRLLRRQKREISKKL